MEQIKVRATRCIGSYSCHSDPSQEILNTSGYQVEQPDPRFPTYPSKSSSPLPNGVAGFAD